MQLDSLEDGVCVHKERVVRGLGEGNERYGVSGVGLEAVQCEAVWDGVVGHAEVDHGTAVGS